MKILVSSAYPSPIRAPQGRTVTFINQAAVDVYLSQNRAQLSRSVAGAVPEGTKLGNTTGSFQWGGFPGLIYARAVSDTEIEVLW